MLNVEHECCQYKVRREDASLVSRLAFASRRHHLYNRVQIAYMMKTASSGSPESCHPATRAAIEYHRSRPATADLDDQFPRADSDVSWATAGCYLYAVIHSCHALTPMMRVKMSNTSVESIYIVVCEAAQCQGYCSTPLLASTLILSLCK